MYRRPAVVDTIRVGNGSIIRGPGILPHSTSAYGVTIRLVNGHAIANLITNCDKSGNQETASVDGVYVVDPGTTGTMTGAAIDFTSVFANSRYGTRLSIIWPRRRSAFRILPGNRPR
jgi:hypothetical protein